MLMSFFILVLYIYKIDFFLTKVLKFFFKKKQTKKIYIYIFLLNLNLIINLNFSTSVLIFIILFQLVARGIFLIN